MADASETSVMNEYISEDKLVDLWPNFPCLFDVRSPDFKNRDKRLKALEEIGKELNQTSKIFGIEFLSSSFDIFAVAA